MRTIYTPDSNMVTFPIPDKYVGSPLEINIFPLVEIHNGGGGNGISISTDDLSFGAWADMEKSDEEICTEIRNGRYFRKRELVL